MSTAKNAILKTKIEGVIYEIMVKTGAANVYVDDTTTLSAKLAEIVASIATKADATHSHAQSDVTGLADALSARPTTDAMNTAISSAISDLIGGAPETYDTLKEIADYIEAHQDVVDALNAAIGQKADKATTLAGYGITDAMTATEINQAISDALAAATGGESAADVKVALDNYKTSNDARVKTIEDDYLKSTDKAELNTVISTAESNAKAYADGLADNYDASGAAAQALTDAKAYTDTEAAKKSTVYFSTTEPAALAAGDLWVHIQ